MSFSNVQFIERGFKHCSLKKETGIVKIKNATYMIPCSGSKTHIFILFVKFIEIFVGINDVICFREVKILVKYFANKDVSIKMSECLTIRSDVLSLKFGRLMNL